MSIVPLHVCSLGARIDDGPFLLTAGLTILRDGEALAFFMPFGWLSLRLQALTRRHRSPLLIL